MIGESEKTLEFINKRDEFLNNKNGWSQNSLMGAMEDLEKNGEVEIGWRQCCGSSDRTQLTHREWVKVVKRLGKDGIELSQEKVKHDNAYATNHGGFWNSIIYHIKAVADDVR